MVKYVDKTPHPFKGYPGFLEMNQNARPPTTLKCIRALPYIYVYKYCVWREKYAFVNIMDNFLPTKSLPKAFYFVSIPSPSSIIPPNRCNFELCRWKCWEFLEMLGSCFIKDYACETSE